jgi:hypothetical protein
METRRFSAGQWIASLMVFLFGLSGQVEGELSLYLYVDGSPEPISDYMMCFGAGEPLPTLGVEYEPCVDGWQGYILSTNFHLINGQIDTTRVDLGDTSITPFNEPRGYEMKSDGFLLPGIQFTMDIYSPDGLGLSYITLWDDASLFDVPVDTFSIYQGGWPGFEDSSVYADVGGPYQLFEGGSVMFDATDSTYTLWFEDGTSSTDSISLGRSLPYWSINGVDIAFGLTPTISYDTLVNGLNLTPGIYDLTFELKSFFGYDTATTTIQIIPEPATGLLLAIGGVVIAIKRRIR